MESVSSNPTRKRGNDSLTRRVCVTATAMQFGKLLVRAALKCRLFAALSTRAGGDVI
jgi:hypothetical protein